MINRTISMQRFSQLAKSIGFLGIGIETISAANIRHPED
ncbi:hypothetical protein EKH55_3112 [Sinorhizobium alkalisoli]|nr:hypothetical protein EKH55_3112 [Sinorhizobium alkalisoli]